MNPVLLENVSNFGDMNISLPPSPCKYQPKSIVLKIHVFYKGMAYRETINGGGGLRGRILWSELEGPWRMSTFLSSQGTDDGAWGLV